MFTLFLLFLFLLIAGVIWWQGLWANLLTWFNLLLSALLACNFYEPLAGWIDAEIAASYTYLIDFLVLWFLFAGFFLLLRIPTDALSSRRVRFHWGVEYPGRTVFALWAAWIVICFAAFSTHTAPLGATPFLGEFQRTPDRAHFLGLGPDRLWLGFLQQSSAGSLSRGPVESAAGPSPYAEDAGRNVFDPDGEFIFKHRARRERFEKEPEYRVNR